MTGNSKDRRLLADALRAHADAVAEEVTDQFLGVHPDWVTRYGSRARVSGVEDARFHITFLAAAIESGAPAAFADYAQWTARVLAARGIGAAFVAESLDQVRQALVTRVPTAASVLTAYTDTAVQALNDEREQDFTTHTNASLTLTRSIYLQAVLAGSRTAALNVVREALRDGVSVLDLYADVLQATLYEVGRLWETNRITVAHEHAATAITQFVMAQMYDRMERSTGAKGRILLTGLNGELHNVGALMVADVLEASGWTVHFLGTNLPHTSILDAIREHQPEGVGISATMLFNVPALTRLVESIRGEWGTARRIVVGGAAFRHAPDLWREIGADGYGRHLRDALDVF